MKQQPALVPQLVQVPQRELASMEDMHHLLTVHF